MWWRSKNFRTPARAMRLPKPPPSARPIGVCGAAAGAPRRRGRRWFAVYEARRLPIGHPGDKAGLVCETVVYTNSNSQARIRVRFHCCNDPECDATVSKTIARGDRLQNQLDPRDDCRDFILPGRRTMRWRAQLHSLNCAVLG